MAKWELLPYRQDGYKIIRRAQCPFCDYIVEYGESGCEYPPVKCPDCARELDYIRKCPHYEGSIPDIPDCNKRGSCYGCAVFQEAHWREGEDY